MAARAAVAAPDIVVVHDGQPVEAVTGGRKGRSMRYYALVGVGAIVVGFVMGQMGQSASFYNETIRDAGKIAETLRGIEGDLSKLRAALLAGKTEADGTQFKVGDLELTKSLAELALAMPDRNQVYQSNLYQMDQGIVDQTLELLVQTEHVYRALSTHVAKTQQDAETFSAGRERVEKHGTPTRYAVYLELPDADEERPITAMFVELGDAVCEDDKPHPEGCNGMPKGYRFRPDESRGWGTMSLAQPGGGVAKKLVPLGFTPTPVLETFFKGAEPTMAEVGYMQRISELDRIVGELTDKAKALRKAFEGMSDQGKRFSFGL